MKTKISTSRHKLDVALGADNKIKKKNVMIVLRFKITKHGKQK